MSTSEDKKSLIEIKYYLMNRIIELNRFTKERLNKDEIVTEVNEYNTKEILKLLLSYKIIDINLE